MLPGKNPVQQFMRHLILAHQRQFLCPVFRDDRHDVGVRAKAGSGGAQAVGHDHVHVLLHKLCPRVFQHILGLHGKAAEYLSFSPVRPQPCQDIIGAFQFYVHVTIDQTDWMK